MEREFQQTIRDGLLCVETGKMPPGNLTRLITHDPFSACVPTAHASLWIEHTECIILHSLHQGTETLLAFAQGPFLVPACGSFLCLPHGSPHDRDEFGQMAFQHTIRRAV